MPFFLHNAAGTFGDGGFWSFNIQTSGSISEAAAETAWGNAVAAFFGDTNVKSYYATQFTFTKTSTSTASATFHQTTKTSTSHSVVGTAVGNQLPTVLGVVASVYTANATKYGRGRIFLPAPTSVILSTDGKGQIDGTHATNIASALTTMFGSLTTAGLTQILYTRKATRGGIAQYTTSQVTSRALQKKIHVQKRRSDKIVAGTVTI